MRIGLRGENLIFLISQPRAGSTLLQLMLAGHPDIATTSEPWIALHPIYALRDNGIDTIYNSQIAQYALLDFLKQSGVDEGFYKNQLVSFLLSLYKQAIQYQKKRFFLDKTPRYYQIARELIELFPAAKFIILFRNPLAVLHSIIKTWTKDNLSLLGTYRDDLMIAPRNMVSCIKRHPTCCLQVNYEELVREPKTFLKKICQFLAIPCFNDMLDYGNRSHPEWRLGDSVGVHRASRPTLDSLDNWRKGFVSPQEKLFARSYLKALGPELIKNMGYDYNEIESSIETSELNLPGNLILWSTIMGEPGELFQTRQIRVERDALIEQRNSLLNSYSWKVTAPARAIVRFLKRGK